MRRVVITGIGIYSCIGNNAEEVTRSLYDGRSGIGIEAERTEYGYRSPLTGIVDQPQLKGVLDRRLRIGLAEEGEYAYMATVEAFANAGIDTDYLENNEMGIFYGNDSSAKAVIEANDIAMAKRDTSLIGSGAIFRSMNSTVTMNLSTIFKLRGANMTISAACASGSHSIGLGYIFIKNGLQDLVLCGGAQETNMYSMGSFDALGAFSTRASEPTKASRPFDKSRDGLIPSGGAASLVLEEYEHAKARGAKIYAEMVGGGLSADAHHLTAPHPDGYGAKMVMHNALEDAGMTPTDIDYINVHGTSTPLGDISELKAIKNLFGEHAYNLNISATKSMTGHLLGATGAVEAIISVLAVKNDIIPPTINHSDDDIDEEIDYRLNLTFNKAQKRTVRAALSNTFGFGGHNASVIVKKI